MKKKKEIIKWCLTAFLILFCAVGVSFLAEKGTEWAEEGEAQKEGGTETGMQEADRESGRYETSGNLPISDNKPLYDLKKADEVTTMYLTVRSGNGSSGTNHTWSEINANSVYYYEELGIDRYKAECILQVGDENGPAVGEFGYGALVPNATVTLRGQTSTYHPQKSYRINIKDGKGSLEEQTVINLNKHANEGVRYRNKLCYDLMSELPGMLSARTGFVHLYVKDETQGGSGEYEDYGLFTQVEQINKKYLKNHGLDRNGQLYKLNFFEFYRYEDVIKLRTAPDYDETLFEEYLEIKGDTDHSKLIEMLTEVNDYTVPIEEVFAKWFDEENFFSWLAFHILTGNKDTQSRNTFLYSPLNVDKWYFISWDNDGAFSLKESELENRSNGDGWETGVSNYWGNILIRRVLKSEHYRQLLEERIEQQREILTQELIAEKIKTYRSVTTQYIFSYPDAVSAPLSREEEAVVSAAIPKEIELNYKSYKESLKAPMPFYIGMPEAENGSLSIVWDSAYDFDEENIEYTVEIADNLRFDNPVYKESGLFYTKLETKLPEAGQYFVRVTAKNESGYEQTAFDYYRSETGRVYGVRRFWVMEDGTVLEDAYEE